MDTHALAEEEAFSFIQQTAMQTRARMRDVATAIVEGTLTP
jgi:AmiR/NasT family two-component response regulator